ncbi:hypothetical protein O181_072503 [Austropuccinia psidii MF-1]|uniref:Altered inheritance of mitochondria protein 41 n=1 Tax=Austropuccinia psidii MF-1 TaxID=1389203 RepID=A0A9Q3F346_9BASI|nr:hypothetical protein [Austropuccinia psidii MF-1]
MKAKDLIRRDTIKSVLGDIQTSQHLKNTPNIKKTLRVAINKREEAAKSFLESNPPRTDLHQQTLTEIGILKEFLPAEDATKLTEDQLIAIIQEAVNTLAPSTIEERRKSLGKMIKSVREIVGERADGTEIARKVKEILELQ